MSKTPFVNSVELTGISLGYRNKAFIADVVLPRVPVITKEFRWLEYGTEHFDIPDTKVGRRGKPGRVEFGATERTGACVDYGLEADVPVDDIDRARSEKSAFNPMNRASEKTTELLLLDREKRVANLIHNDASYSHTETLTGADLWDDPTSKPIVQIMDALEADGVWIRPNTMVIGRKAFTALRRNPSIVKAFNGSPGDDGLVPRKFLEDMFELTIVVGESYYNSARKGQDQKLERIWGNHAALIYTNPNARPEDDLTFGLTAQWGTRTAMSYFDENIGLKGGQVVRVGESVNELIMSRACGYLFSSVISS